MSLFSSCCKPVEDYLESGIQTIDEQHDALLWHKDLTQYGTGYSSIAVVQANARLEDQSQVKVGPYGTIVGIYDGHGGPEASRFLSSSLFSKIEGFANVSGKMSAKVLKQAFLSTEEGFLSLVDKRWKTEPHIASVGSCCLVGAISGNNLYVANVGDSRVVLGTVRHGKLMALRMSQDHNASNLVVRKELKALHSDDSHIVMLKHGVWRVKGIIQISRSIGDAYLKNPQYSKGIQFPRLGPSFSLERPVLSAEPSLHERILSSDDQFLIFASDGLWEHITDQEAVDIVHKCSRNGIARRLVRAALRAAARKREMSYADLRKIEPGVRRYFHDDITVVVVYLDQNSMNAAGSILEKRPRKVSLDSVNAPSDIFSQTSDRMSLS
ncbi:hypothetical protein KP509_22G007100 [Ceratopteris richardii]|uniref:protein-serine/threonine phosphatase n=1 Tax=Ceratopteris richardii TaxID=49495 RepID=A0A8T2S5N5_CERRI|nr:hypothetical protein KP509_22G007100 [Ceratopteris richardii]KAH7306336.1 hypothetical protein KP509_22G007100 [Ceratopteris richardii]